MPTSTLSSLAILKVNIDRGGDYLEYIRPFVLQTLIDHSPDPITSHCISALIAEDYGLAIPERSLQIVLRRIARTGAIKRDYGVYRLTEDVPDPGIPYKRAQVERHIASVVSGLRKYSQSTNKPIENDETAVNAICGFLSEFDITCLRAYLRGTAIPTIQNTSATDVVLVSDYIRHLSLTSATKFESVAIIVQGHMLANALTCPDLANVPTTYRDVTFFLDTPLLVRLLGCDGEAKKDAITSLITLLKSLGGSVSVFSHTRQELKNVIQGATYYLDSPDGKGSIIREAKRRGTSKSDLLLIAESIDEKLTENGVSIVRTPHYEHEFQIDELAFQNILDDEIWYNNPKAIEFDINSVRSVYAIRGKRFPKSIETCWAVLVTSNTKFAQVAWDYGKDFTSTQDVSSVISDFSLANTAWLKSPMDSSSVPTTQMIAFCYAALEPSDALLTKFLKEVDKLETDGSISERNLQLLRSEIAQNELVHLTLGDDSAFNETTVVETLERIQDEIKHEEEAKLLSERESHRLTLDALDSEVNRNSSIIDKVNIRSRKIAKMLAWSVSCLLAVMLIIGLFASAELFGSAPIPGVILIVSLLGVALLTMLNLIFGTNVKLIHARMEDRLTNWIVRREAQSLGLKFNVAIEKTAVPPERNRS